MDGRTAGDAPAPVNRSFRNWTRIGTVGSDSFGIVDPRGLFTSQGQTWSLDWWIGAEDRWHVPAREGSARQILVGDAPVVETVVRVPGGDAAHRAYAAIADEPVAVIEISNRSSLPFAVALAVRPYDHEGLGFVERIDLDDDTVSVNGRPWVTLPSRPQRMSASNGAGGDSARAVFAGTSTEAFSGVRCDAGLAQAAFLFPLAHRATLRATVRLDPVRRGSGRRASMPVPAAVPSGEVVSRGWRAQASARGLRLDLPEGRLASAVEANRGYLLLFQHEQPITPAAGSSLFAALTRYGFEAEAAELARHPARRRWWRERSIRETAADPATAHVPLQLEKVRADLASGDAASLDRLTSLLRAASDTFTWPEVMREETGSGVAGEGHSRWAVAEFLLLVRDLLVREVADGLALCSMLPEAWAHQGIEVHGAPTAHGVLSFALRWHGDRPALLWDLEVAGGRGDVSLTAPGLDPQWSTRDARGEALLSARAGPVATGGSFQ